MNGGRAEKARVGDLDLVSLLVPIVVAGDAVLAGADAGDDRDVVCGCRRSSSTSLPRSAPSSSRICERKGVWSTRSCAFDGRMEGIWWPRT